MTAIFQEDLDSADRVLSNLDGIRPSLRGMIAQAIAEQRERDIEIVRAHGPASRLIQSIEEAIRKNGK